MALCLSLLDDGDFRKSVGLKPVSNCFGSSRFQRRGFTLATSLATFAALAYLTMKSFYLPARGTKVRLRFDKFFLVSLPNLCGLITEFSFAL